MSIEKCYWNRKWLEMRERINNTIIQGEVFKEDNEVNRAKIHTLRKVLEWMDESIKEEEEEEVC